MMGNHRVAGGGERFAGVVGAGAVGEVGVSGALGHGEVAPANASS